MRFYVDLFQNQYLNFGIFWLLCINFFLILNFLYLSEAAPYYPPCIRVMVKEAEHLEPGTLYLITCTGATIGREKNMNHAMEIPDVQVSKVGETIIFIFLFSYNVF